MSMYKRIKFKKFPEINEWLFPKITIILVGGKAGVGKTTAANFINSYLDKEVTSYNYIGSFALGVKHVASMMGWNWEKDTKGRKLLQDVGNLGREYDKDTWINYLLNHMKENIPEELLDIIIVDDWRFPNEAEYFLSRPELYKVFTINIKSPQREILKGTREWKDVSENSLNDYKSFDYIINNNKDLEGFKEDVEGVLLDIISESKKGGKL